jgi:hypothetical protein
MIPAGAETAFEAGYGLAERFGSICKPFRDIEIYYGSRSTVA